MCKNAPVQFVRLQLMRLPGRVAGSHSPQSLFLGKRRAWEPKCRKGLSPRSFPSGTATAARGGRDPRIQRLRKGELSVKCWQRWRRRAWRGSRRNRCVSGLRPRHWTTVPRSALVPPPARGPGAGKCHLLWGLAEPAGTPPQLFDERTLKAGHFLLLHEPRRRSKQGQHGGLLCAQPGRERRGVVFRSWEVRGR